MTKHTLVKYTTHFLRELDQDESVVAVRFWPDNAGKKFQGVWMDVFNGVNSTGQWFDTLEDALAWARCEVSGASERVARNLLGSTPHVAFVVKEDAQ